MTFSVSRRSYLFAHLHLLSSDLFSSDSSHLCFSTVHIVGSFTSKLPSTILYYIILYNIVVHIDIDAQSSACFEQINQLRTATEQHMTATAVVTIYMASADNVLFADGRHIVKIQTPKLWCFFRQRPESAENWRALMESHMQHAHYDLPIILLANFPWILIKDQFSNANKTL